MDTLLNCGTAYKINSKLPQLSASIDESYKDAVARIESQPTKELGLQVIAWLTCAKRQLTILEIQHAFAVEMKTIKLNLRNLLSEDWLTYACAGLVTIKKKSGIVQLARESTVLKCLVERCSYILQTRLLESSFIELRKNCFPMCK